MTLPIANVTTPMMVAVAVVTPAGTVTGAVAGWVAGEVAAVVVAGNTVVADVTVPTTGAITFPIAKVTAPTVPLASHNHAVARVNGRAHLRRRIEPIPSQSMRPVTEAIMRSIPATWSISWRDAPLGRTMTPVIIIAMPMNPMVSTPAAAMMVITPNAIRPAARFFSSAAGPLGVA